MIIDYAKLIGKRVKLVVIYTGCPLIYYDGTAVEWNSETKVLTIRDRFNKTVHIDSESIKQVVEL
jgi:hypothetical protein